LGWLIKLSVVALVILAGVAVYLDAVVQEKFSGKRWTIPATVYARPLELFEGQKLAKQDFLTELDALGYRRESSLSGPGSMSVAANAVELHTRGFRFYEGDEASRRLRVRFSGDFVAGLTQIDGGKLPVARLEPVTIGGLYPAHRRIWSTRWWRWKIGISSITSACRPSPSLVPSGSTSRPARYARAVAR